MRIEVRLPRIEPEVYSEAEECPKCGGQHFKPHGVQGERKTIRDLGHEEVKSFRRKCLRCGYRMRVYPRGVSECSGSTKGCRNPLRALRLR